MPVYQGDGPPRVDEDFSKAVNNKKKSQASIKIPKKNDEKGFNVDDLIFNGSEEAPEK